MALLLLGKLKQLESVIYYMFFWFSRHSRNLSVDDLSFLWMAGKPGKNM